MAGTPVVAAFIAHAAFWALIVYGVAVGELRAKGTAVLLVLWLVGRFGLSHVPYGALMFSPLVALLDIVLVLAIFKGDLRLT